MLLSNGTQVKKVSRETNNDDDKYEFEGKDKQHFLVVFNHMAKIKSQVNNI